MAAIAQGFDQEAAAVLMSRIALYKAEQARPHPLRHTENETH
jgi:hypothetical protein